MWTVEQYIAHRKINNWQELSSGEIEAIAKMLNDIEELVCFCDGMESVEPNTNINFDLMENE